MEEDVAEGGAPVTMLEVVDLRVDFGQAGGVTRAVDGVSFKVAQGETLAVVGESGSGKSVTMLSVMRLLDGRDIKTSGAVLWTGADGASRDLRGLDERGLNALRGSEIAMIFQDASASLNPLLTVGDQIAETVRLHEDAGRAQAWARAVELLTQVGIAAPESRAHSYPHQLSGGMRQRVMIAIALAGRPRLLIADEPTTALDVTIEAQILQLLEDIQRQQGLSIVIVTHDLGVVGEIADRVVVMYAGQIVESGAARDVLGAPRHPYTAALLACLPQLAGDGEVESPFRRAKPGVVPRIGEGFSGCRFRSRCPLARAECEREVPLVETAPGWQSRCFFWEEAS
ncbi:MULTISPECIES: ABC transporter ATP-binding protein [Nitratireductor]|uniref:ABC transporter ATP-binding protein n=1 Tax=Nitratireductor TaxID=245876 RepID=UPI000D0CB279|nr:MULTISPECIES: ABC transporter ATP-binding protein [Nitratireductor]PSM18462.1 ABC transporter ATP-binding protein [Nitratireductor sp. StC3]